MDFRKKLISFSLNKMDFANWNEDASVIVAGAFFICRDEKSGMDNGINPKGGFMSKLMMEVIMEAALQTKVESTIRWLEMGASEGQIARGEDLDPRLVREIAKVMEGHDSEKSGNNPFVRCHRSSECKKN